MAPMLANETRFDVGCRRMSMATQSPARHDRWPRVLLVPPALPFPREPFAKALAWHADLLDVTMPFLFQDFLRFVGREEGLTDLAVRIDVPEDMPPGTRRVDRVGRIVQDLTRYHGIQRHLLSTAEARHMHVVIEAHGAVSLQLLRAERADGHIHGWQFVVAERDLVVEPRFQMHRERGPWTMTWWRSPWPRPARCGWVRTPVPPATADETVDRLVGHHADRIRREVWAARAGGSVTDPVVVLTQSDEGDECRVLERRGSDVLLRVLLTHVSPRIGAAIAGPTRAGVVPVYVLWRGRTGLRWLDLSAGEARHGEDLVENVPASLMEGPSLTLVPDGPEEVEEAAEDLDDPNRTLPPLGEMREWEIEDAISSSAAFDELERLLTLGDEGMDRELAARGFDPVKERDGGAGLSAAVLEALQMMEAKPR